MADRQGIMAGKAFVEFTLSDAGLVKGLASAQKRLETFGAGLANVGKKVAGVGLGITAPMIAAARSFASYGKHLSEVAARTGVAGSSLSELGYAAKETGSSLEDLESGLRTMQLRLLDARGGSETVRKSLAELGLTVDALKKMSPERQFEAIASALASIKDPAKQAKLGIEMFGKAGANLKPLFAGGAAAIKALRDEAKRTGAAISQEDIKSAEELDGAFGRLTTSINAMYVRIGAALAPALIEIMDIIQPIVMGIAKWLKENRELVATVAKMGAVAIVAGGAMYGLGKALLAVSGGIGLVAVAYAGLKTVVLAFSGSGLLGKAFWLALAAGAVYFAANITSLSGVFDWLKERFEDVKKVAGEMMTGISNALSRGDVKAAANLFWAGLVLIWEQQTGDIIVKTKTMIDDVKTKLAEGIASLKSFGSEVNRGRETAGRWAARGAVEVYGAGLKAKNFGKKMYAGAGILSQIAGGYIRSFQGGPTQQSVDRSMTQTRITGIAEDLRKEIAADEQWLSDMRKEFDKQQKDHSEQGATDQKKISNELADQLETIKAQRAESEKAAQERLDAAQKEFDKAKRIADGFPEWTGWRPHRGDQPPKPVAPEMDEVQTEKVDERIKQVVGSRAIFGGDLASQVFGGEGWDKKNYEENKRAREAAERMDKRLEQIERNKALTMG